MSVKAVAQRKTKMRDFQVNCLRTGVFLTATALSAAGPEFTAGACFALGSFQSNMLRAYYMLTICLQVLKNIITSLGMIYIFSAYADIFFGSLVAALVGSFLGRP